MVRKVAAVLILTVITLSAGCSALPLLTRAPTRSLPIYDAARAAVDTWLTASDFSAQRDAQYQLVADDGSSATVHVSLMLQESVAGPWVGYTGDVGLRRVQDQWEVVGEVAFFLSPAYLPRILAGHTRCVAGLAFSADSRTLASGSDDSTVRLWDVAAAQVIRTLSNPGKQVCSVAFSPDDKLLAAGASDGAVMLFDRKNGCSGAGIGWA